MRRLACVDFPALPLQILLRRRSEWGGEPVAVLAEDRPAAPAAWVNRHARAAGVSSGMAQAAAAAVCPELKIGCLPPSETVEEVAELAGRLHRWSPVVESASVPGAALAGSGAARSFWLSASGLSTLFGSPSSWAKAMREDLAARGFHASIAVGFSRFGVFAAARTRFGITIFEHREEEQKVVKAAPLLRFGLPPKILAALSRLGIRTLQDLLRLPGNQIPRRFGPDVWFLYRLAAGEVEPLSERRFTPEAPIRRQLDFEPAERGEGFAFRETIHGGAVPRNYIPAVEQGAREALARGPLGFPVVDVRVSLHDGQHHAVDSSEMAFRLAGRGGVGNGLREGQPVLLEPIYEVRFQAPSVFTGALNPLIAAQRGQILGFDREADVEGWDQVRALMPGAALEDLIHHLRSTTQGVGRFEAELSVYQELYGREADEIVAKRAAEGDRR